MSIQSDITELNKVNQEIKRLSIEVRKLRKQAKDIELRIVDFLKEKDQPGVKYQGKAIILENKEKYLKKKKNEQETDAIEVLSKFNIPNPEDVLKEILNARKGNLTEIPKLKIKKIK
jgi:ABC-type dipeptide/oligopeptide/nickel transport system ATPase component